jgi:SAM-dependent methyltransferase
MNSRVTGVLQCPTCRSALELQATKIVCLGGRHAFGLRNNVPVFHHESVEIVSAEHISNSLGAEFEALLREGRDFILNIGAGATATRYPNCLEFEHKIFPHTDVVGDAHHLPFRDGVFDRVFAFNVFEHLREPSRAAAEILRVLKPGGRVSIHTAFLQSLHEPPFHFYNATEFGVREWFSGFEIQHCSVSGNFTPSYMLGFLLSNLIEAVRASGGSVEDTTTLRSTTLGEWADFWAHTAGPPAAFELLQNLPQEFQARVAAGFELLATKPCV